MRGRNTWPLLGRCRTTRPWLATLPETAAARGAPTGRTSAWAMTTARTSSSGPTCTHRSTATTSSRRPTAMSESRWSSPDRVPGTPLTSSTSTAPRRPRARTRPGTVVTPSYATSHRRGRRRGRHRNRPRPGDLVTVLVLLRAIRRWRPAGSTTRCRELCTSRRCSARDVARLTGSRRRPTWRRSLRGPRTCRRAGPQLAPLAGASPLRRRWLFSRLPPWGGAGCWSSPAGAADRGAFESLVCAPRGSRPGMSEAFVGGDLPTLPAGGERAVFHGPPSSDVPDLERAIVLAQSEGRHAEVTAAAWLLGVALSAAGRYGGALRVLGLLLDAAAQPAETRLFASLASATAASI